MGQIENKFKELEQKKKKAFIIYLPFGFPTLKRTRDIILEFQSSGVDLIELGIPFSDPIADGPILQEASEIALKNGATIQRLFSFLKNLKKKLRVPVVILTYYNPIFRFGLIRFLRNAKDAGVGGIMVVDLPMEEATSYVKRARSFGLDTIFFITPTTSPQRIKKIVKLTKGFIYYISLTGITGPKNLILKPLFSHINALKRITDLAICVGFGIHKPAQVKALTKVCDGVILGSIVAKFIKDNYKKKNFLKSLNKFVKDFYV